MVGVRGIDAGSVGGRRASMSRADERTIAAFAGPVASELAYELPECRYREMGRVEQRLFTCQKGSGVVAIAAIARRHRSASSATNAPSAPRSGYVPPW